MIYSNFIAALDLGSTHITLALGTKTTNGEINVIDYEKASTSNVKWGKITNEVALSKEIQSLILKVQQRHSMIIEKVYVTTSALGLYSDKVKISKTLGEGSIVTVEVLNSMKASEELKLNSSSDSRIYTQPLSYSINGEKISEVEGKMCQRIEAEYLVVDADRESFGRIISTLKYAEVALAEIFLAPQAMSEAVLTLKEKNDGVAAIEIGSASTKVAIYKEDKLQFLTTMPLGCNMIVNDLCNYFSLTTELAHKLLMQSEFGAVCANLVEDVQLELSTKFDIDKKFLTREIVEVIEARLEEILLNVKYQIEMSGFMNLLMSGLVVTGCVTNINNLSSYVKLKTNLNVRVHDLNSKLSESSALKLENTDAELCGMLILGKNICKKEERKDLANEPKELVAVKESVEQEKKEKQEKKGFRWARDLFDVLLDTEDTEL